MGRDNKGGPGADKGRKEATGGAAGRKPEGRKVGYGSGRDTTGPPKTTKWEGGKPGTRDR
jgi:hypothetical protein